MSDTLIHLQGSQALEAVQAYQGESDTLIHLQGSQAYQTTKIRIVCLIPLFTYKVLKPYRQGEEPESSLIPLFTYKVLKRKDSFLCYA